MVVLWFTLTPLVWSTDNMTLQESSCSVVDIYLWYIRVWFILWALSVCLAVIFHGDKADVSQYFHYRLHTGLCVQMQDSVRWVLHMYQHGKHLCNFFFTSSWLHMIPPRYVSKITDKTTNVILNVCTHNW